MRKVIMIVLMLILGGGTGFGFAYLVSQKSSAASTQPLIIIDRGNLPKGRTYIIPRERGEFWGGMGRMMQPYPNRDQAQTGMRITLDQAVEKVNSALSHLGSDLQVAEVMEFQNNFYAVVTEKSTGRGAFELLVDPYTGAVSYEPGPNMMWNLKYGPMQKRLTITLENSITLAEAKDLAQKALESEASGATLESSGYDFYGYYTFDYQVDGKITGMLSVNGTSGEVWFHTWHGVYISEKEISE
jgi:hypothetical protein